LGKEGGSECEKNPGWEGCGMSRKYHKSFLEDEMVKEKDDIGNFVRWGIGGRGRWVGQVGGWMDHWLPTYLPTYLLSMYDQGKRVVCSAFLFLFRRWKGGYGPMKRGGRCGCGCGWMMLRGGGG